MLDIRYIRDNAKLVQENTKNKGYDIDINALIELDTKRRDIQNRADELRERRNNIAAQMKNGKPNPDLIAEGKSIKNELVEIEKQFKNVDDDYLVLLESIPNMITGDVPLGGEKDSVEIKKYGDQKVGAVDHLDFAMKRDWIDFERGSKVAGAKFYYLKGDLALLENAIYQFALNFLVEKGFTFMTVPHMVSSRILTGTGFAPRTSDQSDEYAIEGDDLSLIATAEIPLTGYHADEIIDEDKLPLLYAGYSPCYRKEAGTYGKFTRGLFRVHQFNKLEMYAYSLPEKSAQIHEMILENEEAIWQAIGIPYHVVNIAAGDLGAPAAKKYDIEYWSPVDEMYRELTSCSNCTDFQTRNLNIRVRRKNGSVEILHSLNGTAVSLARSLVAIIENFQNENGKLIVPKVIRPYMNGRELI
jgi:seryl-tRNA synthetase